MVVPEKRHGGPRLGSGRPRSPRSEVREHKVVVMMTAAEIKALKKLAKGKKLPTATLAHQMIITAMEATR